MSKPIDRAVLEDIISYYNEGNNLDFKAIQYKKEQFPDLLRDIISMANSFSKDDRYIIIGVKLYADGSRSIDGITDVPGDAAIYQQLVHENVEPDLTIDYFPFMLEGKQLMIFRLTGCANPPFLMKKDYATLKKGDGFIRKGSHQTRLTRADLDRIFAEKISQSNIVDHDISVIFDKSNQPTLTVKSLNKFMLPSEVYKAEIMALLDLKGSDDFSPVESSSIRKMYEPQTAYENINIEKLHMDLVRAEKAYELEDHNCKFGELGTWLNFILYNNGSDYVKDASLEIAIPQIHGIEFATRLYSHSYHAPAFPSPPEPSPGEYRAKYPAVGTRDNQYILFQDIGDVKRFVPYKAFRLGISLFLPESIAGQTLVITSTLFGQNLASPIKKYLTLEIQPKEQS